MEFPSSLPTLFFLFPCVASAISLPPAPRLNMDGTVCKWNWSIDANHVAQGDYIKLGESR